jgi:hypothetical protein
VKRAQPYVLESIGEHSFQPVVTAIWADPRAMLGLLQLARHDQWAMTWATKILKQVFPDQESAPGKTAFPGGPRALGGDAVDGRTLLMSYPETLARCLPELLGGFEDFTARGLRHNAWRHEFLRKYVNRFRGEAVIS